jgi:hypothetical protein
LEERRDRTHPAGESELGSEAAHHPARFLLRFLLDRLRVGGIAAGEFLDAELLKLLDMGKLMREQAAVLRRSRS